MLDNLSKVRTHNLFLASQSKLPVLIVSSIGVTLSISWAYYEEVKKSAIIWYHSSRTSALGHLGIWSQFLLSTTISRSKCLSNL